MISTKEFLDSYCQAEPQNDVQTHVCVGFYLSLNLLGLNAKKQTRKIHVYSFSTADYPSFMLKRQSYLKKKENGHSATEEAPDLKRSIGKEQGLLMAVHVLDKYSFILSFQQIYTDIQF